MADVPSTTARWSSKSPTKDANHAAPAPTPRQGARARTAGPDWPLRLILLFLFVRLSYVHEIAAAELGVNSYLMYLVGIPALLAYFNEGGIRKSRQYRVVDYWLMLWAWMIVTVPFSYYRSKSLDFTLGYFKASVLLVFLVTSLHRRPAALDSVLKVIFWAGIVNLLSSFRYAGAGERFALAFGNMANANDWAAHLLFMLPFLLLPVFLKRPLWNRLLAVGASSVALHFIFSTASRGAAVGLGVEVLLLGLMLSWRRRVLLMVLGAMAAGVLTVTVSDSAFSRIQSLFVQSPDVEVGQQSLESRQYFLERSIDFTLDHPIFGVGPGQFGTALGIEEGNWKAAHNSITQISSETGFPGIILFLIAVGISGRLILRAHRQGARNANQDPYLAVSASVIGVSAAGYLTAALFLNLGYTQYFPLTTALAVLLDARRQAQLTDLRA